VIDDTVDVFHVKPAGVFHVKPADERLLALEYDACGLHCEQ